MLTRRSLLTSFAALALGALLELGGAHAQVSGGPALPLYPTTSYEAAAGVTPTNIFKPPGNALRYGMVGDGTLGASTGTDNTAAFNNFITVLLGGGTPQVAGFVPCGLYRFASKPNTIGNAVIIKGEGKGCVQFLRDYNEATATNGFIESNSGALVFQDIYLLANNGHTGGAAIHLLGQVAGGPDFSQIRGIYISGNNSGTWNYGFYFDGQLKTSPAGIRDLYVDDCNIFAATTDLAAFITLNNGYVGCNFFPAGGTATTVRLTGISTNTSNNNYINSNFIQDLILDWSNYATVRGGNGITTITNTANDLNNTVISPNVTSTIQTNWNGSGNSVVTNSGSPSAIVTQSATSATSFANPGIGGTWCIQATTANTVASNITLANDPRLTFTSVPVGDYEYDVNASFTYTNATGGVNAFFGCSAGTCTALTGYTSGPQNGMSGCNNVVTANPATGNPLICTGATGTAAFIAAHGHIQVTATATIALQWSQNSSNASATTRTTASHLCLRRLN